MYTDNTVHVIFIISFFLAYRFLLASLWLLVVILVAEDAFGIRWKFPMLRGAPENTHSWPNQGIKAGRCTLRKTKYLDTQKIYYEGNGNICYSFALRTPRFLWFLRNSFLMIDKTFQHHSHITTYVTVTVPSGIWTNCQLAI